MQKLSSALVACFFLILGTATAQQGQYTLRYDAGTSTYTVYAKVNTAYAPPQSRFLNVFVTVMAPTGTLTPSNVSTSSGLASSNVVTATRINAPSYNNSKDYHFFNFDVGSSNYTPHNIAANTEFAVFSFQNSVACGAGTINLIVHGSSDHSSAQSNSINASNALEILGAGGETYASNYGTAAVSCAATPPTITTSFSPNPMTAGQNGSLTLTATNSAGNPPQSGVGYTYVLPSGLTFPVGATVTNSCGGTAVVTNSTTLTFTGGTMTSGQATCTISVPVVAPSAGSVNPGAGAFSNITQAVIGPNNGAGVGAGNITVNPAGPACAANAGTLSY
jgi:hypothetical protein